MNGFQGDVCPQSTIEEVESGWISSLDRFGCLDSDMDGYSNPDNWWISHPDGFADAFPDDESQWYDTDKDGYGDNLEYFDGETWRPAWRGDGCVATEGNSTMDRWGCPDFDGDGWSRPQLTGLQAREESVMLGLLIQLNGMTVMVMVEVIIQRELQPMFVLMFQEPQRVQPLVETDGDVMIQMAMAGLTRVIDSHTNQLSGVI